MITKLRDFSIVTLFEHKIKYQSNELMIGKQTTENVNFTTDPNPGHSVTY